MRLIPLAEVGHALKAGAVLPWGVRDSNGVMLLAKGYLLPDERWVSALLDRGMYVDFADVEKATSQKPLVQIESMENRWQSMQTRLSLLLRSSTEQYFMQRVTESIAPIAALADSNVDLLIFLILRHDHMHLMKYGIIHSLHSASLCSLLSRRLGWSESRRYSLIGAALTMNISMLELQGQLALRGGRPTESERKIIDEHPLAAAEILRQAGLDDQVWLNTVEQHHEIQDGQGYPKGIKEPSEMSQLLRFVDAFTAKHSPRKGRKPQPAQQAARELFTQSGGHPLVALLIKELGIYPPGVFVKLVNGEIAIVTHRGHAANTPVVSSILNKNGDALAIPARRDTSQATYAITSVAEDYTVKVPVSVDALYDRGKT